MTLDELLLQLRLRRLVLISAREVWPSPRLTCTIRKAVRKHERGLALLIDGSSIEACPNRDLHRQYWDYRRGAWICRACSWLRESVNCGAAQAQEGAFLQLDTFMRRITAQINVLQNPTSVPRRSHVTLK